MPRRTRRGKRRRQAADWQRQYLIDGLEPDIEALGLNRFEVHDYIRDPANLWAARRDEILPSFVKAHPGTRPYCWWIYDAPRAAPGVWPRRWQASKLPEPRARVGGVGKPLCWAFGFEPKVRFGIPTDWIVAGDTWARLLGARYVKAFLVDPANPPRFEGQAVYLERHGLLLSGEKPPRAAFADEIIDVAALIDRVQHDATESAQNRPAAAPRRARPTL